jgi:hypothetical protein
VAAVISIAQVAALEVNVARWATRNVDIPQPQVRQAANNIVAGIDAMLADLYLLRGRTVTEMRQHDDLYHARLDALLAERRAL